MAAPTWALQMMQRFPHLFKSGFFLNPKAKFVEDGPHYHDFDIFNPNRQKIGSASTSYDHINTPGKIYTENIEAARLPDQNRYPNLHGQPWSLGYSGTRDLGRQLNLYYEQQYPGHVFPDIGGIRVSGARANGPVPFNYAGVPEPMTRLDMKTRFKPAIAAPFAVGAIGNPFDELQPPPEGTPFDWPQVTQ